MALSSTHQITPLLVSPSDFNYNFINRDRVYRIIASKRLRQLHDPQALYDAVKAEFEKTPKPRSFKILLSCHSQQLCFLKQDVALVVVYAAACTFVLFDLACAKKYASACSQIRSQTEMHRETEQEDAQACSRSQGKTLQVRAQVQSASCREKDAADAELSMCVNIKVSRNN